MRAFLAQKKLDMPVFIYDRRTTMRSTRGSRCRAGAWHDAMTAPARLWHVTPGREVRGQFIELMKKALGR